MGAINSLNYSTFLYKYNGTHLYAIHYPKEATEMNHQLIPIQAAELLQKNIIF